MAKIKTRRLHWIGHVLRAPEEEEEEFVAFDLTSCEFYLLVSSKNKIYKKNTQ